MGFCLQVKLLLWKNFVLKKRKPLVLMFEIFIPLVLFLILIGIRQKQPGTSVGSLSFGVFPLPSAGVIPVMQSFCDHEDKDKNGFSSFPNSSVKDFLKRLNSVAENHNHFQPDITPTELDEIPSIYRSIIEDPIALKAKFENAADFQIGDLLDNRTSAEEFLHKNFSLSHDAIAVLFNSSINTKELYQLMFGVSNSANDHLDNINDVLLNEYTGAGLIYQILPSQKIFDLIPLLLNHSLETKNVVNLLSMMFFSPKAIRFLACNETRIPVLSTPSAKSQKSLLELKQHICQMDDQHLNTLSLLLREQISTDKIMSMFDLSEWDINEVREQHIKLASSLRKFNLFERIMRELSAVASALPQDACYSFHNTSESISTTIKTPIPDDEDHPKPDTQAPGKVLHPQNGLVRIWMTLQKQVCGKETKSPKFFAQQQKKSQQSHYKEHTEELTLDDLDLTNQQKEQIKILVHVLYSNPKVLYTPNNTAADKIIEKANETFVLLDTVTQFAHKLRNISIEIQEFLNQNSTEKNLVELKKIQTSLRNFPHLLALDPDIKEFVEESSIPNKRIFVEQLNAIDNAACSWISLMSNISLNVFHGFSNEDDLIKYFKHKAYFDNVTVLASVVFKMGENGSMPYHMVYTIRQNASFTVTTNLVRGRFWFPGPRNWGYYYYQFGFVWIQDILERAMISLYAGRDVVEPGTYIHQFPYPCYVEDEFLFMIEHVMPLCLAVSWVYLVAMLVQNIVYEKEARLKEVMKMMGLANGVHWVAWFITSFVQMSVTVLILTLILKCGLVLTYSNPLLIFLVLEIFAIVNIVFSFLVSVLYSKAKLAAACAGIIYFLSYVPYMYIAVREEAAHDHIPGWLKTIACLLSTTALGMGAKYFAFYEEMGVGVQWSNIHKSPVEDDEFHLLGVIMMMIFDIFIYAILVWYIENVHPGSYGLPKPWYFPFTKSYWLGHGRAEEECGGLRDCFRYRQAPLSVTEEDQACAMLHGTEDSTLFESEPSHLNLGVCIDNLIKVYSGTNKIAVNKLTLNLYEGQITSFLGHNGAGKTTTMSILTGLFPPTSGHAIIYENDIRTEMDSIRKSLGMCPQHNVLFDELTVEEHLWFYARLKGMSNKDIQREMNKLIEDVGLPMKRHQKVDCLSGGMKRKLSVGIAFVGGSRTVILDEPTAGIDPYARRAIWDLIIKYKKDRTILLSTHHMDEADILGDRIAIIANGQLKCCGSPLFLKNNLGDGYHLYLVKKLTETASNGAGGDVLHPSFFSLCHASDVGRFIQQYVSTAYLVSETKHELHYVLPTSELKKGGFEKLFEVLEQSLDELHICSYGIKNPTLEEVFLKVAEGVTSGDLEMETDKIEENPIPMPSHTSVLKTCADMELNSISNATSSAWDSDYHTLENSDTDTSISRNCRRFYDGAGTRRVEGNWLLLQQFWAILVKRYIYTRRNWKGLFSQILLPTFFVSVAMSVALTAPQMEDLPPLILSPSQYYNYTQPLGNVIPFSNLHLGENEPRWGEDACAQDIESSFLMPSGIGATCVLKSPFYTFDADKLNTSVRNFQLLTEYFEPSCESVFVPGLQLENFVPPAPTVRPSEEIVNATIITTALPQITTRYYPICHCSADKTGFICAADGYENPASFKVVTGDILLNISGQSEHEYYLYSTDMYRLRRYGALSLGHVRNFVPPNFGKKAPALFRKVAVRHAAKVWFNNKGFHSMPTYINTLNNAILRANLNSTHGNPAAYGITVINHPMVDTTAIPTRDQILQGTDVLIAIFIIVAMSFVPASFVLFLVYERYTKSKHLQAVSGVHPVIYWVANYFWDMCNYVVPATCCVFILLIFNIPAYVSKTNFPAVVSLFLMYGWSITPIMYPASFLFKEPSSAYVFLIVINLFIGITCIVTSFLLEVFSSNPFLGDVHTVVKPMFLLFPNYCLGRGLMDIAFNEYNNFFLLKSGQYDRIRSPFAWNLVTRNLVVMAVCGIAFFIITLLCEFRFFRKPRQAEIPYALLDVEEDADVLNERKRVVQGNARGDLLKIENLTKIYHTPKLGSHLAVDRLCVGIPEGECFGLLGVNGAGKSTTFKMLTGDTSITAGDAVLNGYSVHNDLKNVQQYIGYCPQFDALYDELTAREHLTLYARFRGIPLKEEKQVVEWALNKLDLMKFADKPSGTYSGGTKRKLSTAIALIGGPPVIYLDEPTTGMDPHSRRFLWNLIISLVRDGRSIVLTSHSMEECEALCTRLAIMVNGRFRCLGSIQHLKNRFGEGYSILVRTRDHQVEPVLRFFRHNFPESVLKERHHNIVQFELKTRNMSLASIFSKMEQAQAELSIEDYSVCQTTLDNVFINFVKQQSDIQAVHRQYTVNQSDLLMDSSDDEMPNLLENTGTRLSFLAMEVE